MLIVFDLEGIICMICTQTVTEKGFFYDGCYFAINGPHKSNYFWKKYLICQIFVTRKKTIVWSLNSEKKRSCDAHANNE